MRFGVDRALERTVAVASVAAAVASVAWLKPDAAFAGLVALVAVCWGVAPFAIRAFLAPVENSATALPGEPGDERSVTTIVVVGEEPPDLARATIALASRAGPTIVATRSGDLPDDLAPIGVPVIDAADLGGALDLALASVGTEAVFVTSASTFPTASVTRAAAILTGEVGWVVGRVDTLAHDAFGPSARDGHAARLRLRERRGGLVTWEPDATIVRTELLVRASTGSEGLRGDWLRLLAEEGWVGAEVDEVVAVHAAPTDGPLFWPAAVMGRRGLVADLARAARGGGPRARLLAAAGLLDELAGYQLLLWVALPVLVASSATFPFRVGATVFAALHFGLAAARWAVSRRIVGSPLRPSGDARAAVYELPASLLSLPSLSGRIRRLGFRFPGQPLLFAAFAVTCAVAVPLLDRPATADTEIDGTVGLAILALVALWACAVQAVGRRAWTRSTYRLAVDLPVTVGGVPGRVRDGSPTGAAVVGPFGEVHVGDRTTMTVTLPGGDEVDLAATVVDRHRAGHDTVALGLSLAPDRTNRPAWVGGLVDAHDRGPTARAERHDVPRRIELAPHQRPRRIARRIEAVAVGAVSVALVTAVALSLAGYRVLVIRSGSMVPTLRTGDVVVVDWTRAGDLRVGDIVTYPSPELGGQTITHRVRSITDRSGGRLIETRGDHNDVSEFWEATGDRLVGREVASIPAVGGWIAGIGRVRAVLLALASTLVGFAVVLARAAKPSDRPLPDVRPASS